MLRAATLVSLMLLLLTSCKNAGGGKENLVAKPAPTTYLKDTPQPIEASVLEHAPKDVHEFYAAKGNFTLWINADDRVALQQAIAGAATDGLLPEEYNLTFLKDFEALKVITPEECMRYDVMMTTAFRDLATHLFKGRLKPSGVYADWALAPKPFDYSKLLTETLEKHDVADVINRCRPRHELYNSLRNSLAKLNALPDDSALPKIVFEKNLKLNDSSETVGTVKRRLAYWGDLVTDSVTNVYDKATVDAVKKFQQRHGIYDDGVVNSRTAEALAFTRNERREQVIANLERWRWFPYDFGERALLVNIPTYRLAVLENGKDTVATYKVVVGKPERRTPVLHSVINAIVINPTWTVPPTIIKEDLTPAAIKSREYFTNLNMKIFMDGLEVAPKDWDPTIAEEYRYVQGPGDHNSLGRIKFNFSNTFSVYLHDTNHREMFAKPYRALSSGCVRVQDPFKLANYVLGNENDEWTNDKLQQIVDTEETKNVLIKKSIQVHQLYWTAWMDKSGLQFRNDIYSLDKILYDKLRQHP